MKITSLDLIRYGHFTGGRLEFGTQPGVVTTVLAGNAAGKTTALNALRDLLFGIPRNSPYRFLHNDDPRIGGEIVTDGGTTLRFERKKGSQRGLLGEDNRALAPEVLQHLLGPVDRELFEKLFGLDHAQLRSAGEELARGEGRLAEALFVAASGLRGLRGFSEGLCDESEGLLTSSGRSGTLIRALRDLNETESSVRRTLRQLRADGFQRLERDMREAEGVLEVERERVTTEARRKSALERLNRTIPLLGELQEIRLARAVLGAIHSTDPTLCTEWEEITKLRAEAAAKRNTLGILIAEKEGTRRGLRIDDRLLAVEADVLRLQEDLGAARQAHLDLPKREVQLRQQRGTLVDLCRQVAITTPPEEALEQVPPRPLRAEVRAAARAMRELAVLLPAAERRRDNARNEFAEQSRRLAKLGAPVEDAALRVRLKGLIEEGLAALLTDVEGRMQSALGRADQQASGSRHWRGTAEQLAARPLPERALVERYRQVFDKSENDIDDLTTRLAEAVLEEQRIAEALAALADGPLPTPERITAARVQRDATWTVIRRHFVVGEALDDELARAWFDLIADEDPSVAFDTRMGEADRLADDRAEQAERVERFREHQRQQGRYMQRRADLVQELTTLRAGYDATRSEWRALWVPAGIEAGEPAEMLEWLVRCEEARKRYEEGSGLALEAQRLRARLAEETAALLQQPGDSSAVSPPPAADVLQAFQAAVATAEASIEAATAAAAQRSELEERVESLRRDAADAEGDHRTLEERRQALLVRWQRALQGLAWSADASAEEAESVVDVYDAIEQQVPALRESMRRIDGIGRVTAAFSEATAWLAHSVAPDLVGADVFIAAEGLRGRLDAVRTASATSEQLDRDLAGMRRDLEHADREVHVADDRRATLLECLGVGDDDAARVELDRIAAWQSLQDREDKILDNLRTAGDGETLEALERAAEGCSLDDVRAELDSLSQTRAHTTAAVEAAVAAVKDLEKLRSERMAAEDTAALALRREDLRRSVADLATRYAVVKTAEILLGQAIDRFREESAGPQLARASELFAHLTGGAYERLFAEQDDAGTTVLRTRHRSGRVKGAPALSDGERDQLYLALRVAAIEEYVTKAEPMPFIADDLLVHFDDSRASRALETLRGLAERVQVIFLTHHAHLVDIARDTLGPDGIHLIGLPDPAI